MPWVRREAFPLGFPWDRGELGCTTPTTTIRITASLTPHDFASGSRQADGERSFVLTNQVRLYFEGVDQSGASIEVVDQSGAITLRVLTNLVLALNLLTNQVRLL
jgi:hypothetical protein